MLFGGLLWGGGGHNKCYRLTPYFEGIHRRIRTAKLEVSNSTISQIAASYSFLMEMVLGGSENSGFARI